MIQPFSKRPPQCTWILHDESIQKHIFSVAVTADDDTTEASWISLSESFNKLMPFLLDVLKVNQ